MRHPFTLRAAADNVLSRAKGLLAGCKVTRLYERIQQDEPQGAVHLVVALPVRGVPDLTHLRMLSARHVTRRKLCVQHGVLVWPLTLIRYGLQRALLRCTLLS